MTIERIRTLISSNQDEKKIAKKLIKLLKPDPSLVSNNDIFNRNIFHLLVLNNKYQALAILLKEQQWQKVALSGDRSGNTILHYIVAKGIEDDHNLMSMVLEQLPDIINSTNVAGNTALHEAIISQKLWAVHRLVKCNNIDRSIKNQEGQTVLDLAEDQNEFKQALLYINLSSLDLRNRFKRPCSKDNLREAFPVLSSRNYSDSSSSPKTSELLHSPLIFTESSISELGDSDWESSDLEEEKEDKRETETKMEKVLKRSESLDDLMVNGVLKKLALTFKQDRKSPLCYELQELFDSHCRTHCLSNQFKLDNMDNIPEIAEVVAITLNKLHGAANERYVQIQNSNYKILNMFIFMLINNNLMADARPRNKPVIHHDYLHKAKVLKTIWRLTACQDKFNAKREFDFEIIAQRALGILLSHSYLEVLVCIRRLYSDFDRAQKLVANFVVLQLLIYHVNDKVVPLSAINVQFRFIYRLNVDENHGLGKLGKQINTYLQKAIKLNMEFSRQPLLKNVHLLNRQVNEHSFTRMNQSFDLLVNEALTKPRKKRKKQVSLIANELRMLTIFLYQRACIAEFADSNWLKKDNLVLSPHVVMFTQLINKLSAYFAEKILLQSASNMKNTLQFLSEITEAICPLDGERYPDLNSSMILSSVFNRHCISRLALVFTTLEPNEQNVIQEIDRMTSKEKNSKFMRAVYNNYKTALPFCGELLTRITFANDGNENRLIRAQVFGLVLKELMEVKLLTNFERTHFQTDLPVFFTEYQEPDEEYLDNWSYRHQPNKAHVVNLDEVTNNFDSLLDDLKSTLAKNILPGVIWNGELYPPNQLAAKLIHFFTNQLNSLTEEDLLSLAQSFNKLQETINKVIEINNNFYYPKELADKLKISSYVKQLGKLEKRIASLGILSAQKEKKEQVPEKEHPSRKENTPQRKSVHFLEGVTIFPTPKKASDTAASQQDDNLSKKHGT